MPISDILAAPNRDRFTLDLHNLIFRGVQVFSAPALHDRAWSLGSSTYVTQRPNVKSIIALQQQHALQNVSSSIVVPAG